MFGWGLGLKVLGWLSGIKAGAGRWINAETGKALMVAVVMIGLVAGGTLLFAGGKSSGGARVEAAWLNAVNKLNAVRQRARAAQAIRIAAAAQAERDSAEAERDEAISRAANLEVELAVLKSKNEIAFPKKLAGELNK